MNNFKPGDTLFMTGHPTSKIMCPSTLKERGLMRQSSHLIVVENLMNPMMCT